MNWDLVNCSRAGRWGAGVIVLVAVFFIFGPMATAEFTYQPPGDLVSGSGTGVSDFEVYVPGMRYPIEESPSFANSQVWGHGGMNGPGGGQCDSNNYSYPWWDNFCESRSWEMPFCPSGTGHQGQDIRPATCTDKAHWAVAAEAGDITHIGSYSVNLVAGDGTRHRYLHMDPGTLAVNVGDSVSRGDRLGLVSNAFGGTPTTIHLHYDIRRNVSGMGQAYIPTYMSLVRSYQDLIGQPEEPCGFLEAAGGIIDNDDDCFRLLGNIGTWRTESEGYGASLHWTYAYDGDDPDGYARWTLHFEESGPYRVEVYVETEYAESEQARYVLRAAGGETELRLDQSAAYGWRELGEFEFAADDDEWLGIYDNTGEPFADRLRFVADAIRLTAVVEEPEGDADAGGDLEPGDGDGGAVGDGSADGDGSAGDAQGDGQAEEGDNDGIYSDRSYAVETRSCAQTTAPQPLSMVFLVMVGLFWMIRRREIPQASLGLGITGLRRWTGRG